MGYKTIAKQFGEKVTTVGVIVKFWPLSGAIPHLKRTIPPGEDFNWISLNKQPWNQLFVFYLPFFGWLWYDSGTVVALLGGPSTSNVYAPPSQHSQVSLVVRSWRDMHLGFYLGPQLPRFLLATLLLSLLVSVHIPRNWPTMSFSSCSFLSHSLAVLTKSDFCCSLNSSASEFSSMHCPSTSSFASRTLPV